MGISTRTFFRYKFWNFWDFGSSFFKELSADFIDLKPKFLVEMIVEAVIDPIERCDTVWKISGRNLSEGQFFQIY